MAPLRLFCFGLGYSARPLAAAVMAQGWRVAGSCRSSESQAALRDAGIEAFLFDRGRPLDDAGAALRNATHLLSSVPPDVGGDPVLDQHAADIAAVSTLEWAGYLSTTGVYGDRDGGWVDENSALQPTGERGRRRVNAERGWLDMCRRDSVPAHIFRLAGIYGPGRNALESVRSGRARRIVKQGQMFSRIHRDDIVAVLRASMAQVNPGAVYNLCDDEAAPPQDVIAFACELLGVPPPPATRFEDADLSDMARSFYRDNKRVANRRIKEELGVELVWPDYRAGLRGLLAARTAPD